MAELDQETEALLIERWCAGDAAAIALVHALFTASQLADDVIDKDGGINALADQARLLMVYFGDILPNPFAQAHASVLAGAIVPAIANWASATAWEHSQTTDEERLLFAYVLRESLESAVVAIAYLIGGAEHALLVRKEIAEIYHFGPGREGWESWKAERLERVRD
jgi:hypothetical protein